MGLTRPRAYQIFDIDYKQSVRVVTVSNVTLGGGAPSQVDGVSLSLNDRVLVTAQSTANQNGLYYVTTVGTGSNGTWARSIDGNETGEIDAGMVVMVTEGLVYADTQWKLITDDPIIIGTTALSFTQNYSANSISSGTSNVSVYSNANVTISAAGTPNVLSIASSGATVKGNLLPDANVTYSLGSTSQRWKDLWISNSTIYIGETNITASGTTLIVGGANVVTQTSSGNITASNVNVTGEIVAVGNVTGNYILGNGALLTGVITSVANINSGTSNITVVSPGGNITVGIAGTSNVAVFSSTGQNITGYLTTSGNITGLNFIGNGSTLTNLTGANVTGTVANATYATSAGSATSATSATTAGTVTTAAQPNITSVGTLSSLTVSGNITAGNLTGATLVSATNLAGTITTAAQPNITSIGSLGTLTVNSGNITGAVIINAGANSVGNIGSSTGYFNTAHVKAALAQYADLAEMYVADADYAPGTVVEFGGNFEITQTTTSCSTAVAGIISTNPSYLMNSAQSGEIVLPVALTGRVPCQVLGPVKKGDVLVSSNLSGIAQRIGSNWQPGCTVGKAMEDISESIVKVIEVAVGRL